MSELLDEIRLMSTSVSSTKLERIIQGVINCINDDKMSIGDILPSVNDLSKRLGYSRETVVKAYAELKSRGIILSKPGVGYFIANHNPDLKQSIALLLYGFQTFQQDFYNSFRDTLGEDYKIDVFFHHNNQQVYNSILDVIIGKYGMYVIAPIQNEEAQRKLEGMNAERLLLIDRYLYVNDRVSKVTQEFQQSMLRVLEELKEKIKQYQELVIYYREDTDYPKGIFEATKSFCKDHQIKLKHYKAYSEVHLKKGTLFFTIGDSDLWALLKSAKEQNLELGKDIGILSHNDNPVKEIIQGGITTFSTDFKLMAKSAAQFVKDKNFVNTIIPSVLIKRKSL